MLTNQSFAENTKTGLLIVASMLGGAVDGKRVESEDDFLTQIEEKQPGEQVTLEVVRGGERRNVTLTLDAD